MRNELEQALDAWENKTIQRRFLLCGLISTSEILQKKLKDGVIKDDAYIERMKKLFDIYESEKEHLGCEKESLGC